METIVLKANMSLKVTCSTPECHTGQHLQQAICIHHLPTDHHSARASRIQTAEMSRPDEVQFLFSLHPERRSDHTLQGRPLQPLSDSSSTPSGIGQCLNRREERHSSEGPATMTSMQMPQSLLGRAHVCEHVQLLIPR